MIKTLIQELFKPSSEKHTVGPSKYERNVVGSTLLRLVKKVRYEINPDYLKREANLAKSKRLSEISELSSGSKRALKRALRNGDLDWLTEEERDELEDNNY